jgi:hypothetical protein
VSSHERACLGRDINEPRVWDFDDDMTRREPVIDPNYNPPRIVRHVGYRRCMCCSRPFFSSDVAKIRLCSPCKAPAQMFVPPKKEAL